MYNILKIAEMRTVLIVEAPSLAMSILIAEIFYKFGSFTLEVIVFLPTWLVTGFVISLLGRQIGLLREN